MSFINGVFDMDQIITNQIIAAKVAESALKDLEGEAEIKMLDVHEVLDEL